MRRIYIAMCCLWAGISGVCAQDNTNKVRITLRQAIQIAQLQSVDAAVALNELRTAYWEFRTHRADQLPEVIFTGTLPSYSKQYSKDQQSDGSYTYVQNNALGLNGEISIAQNIALTGGKIALNTSLDFTRQLGSGAYNEFMSVPVSLTLTQPIFGVNDQKWKRRIEPVRYQEAKAAYMENVENVTRKIGHISESELMRLKQSALQAKGKLTEAQSNYNAMMFKLRSFLGMSEQDVIEPVLPEAIEGVRMDYQAVLEKAQENNSFSKNIMRRQLEADYDVATAKGNRRSINLFASVGYTGKDMSMRGAYNPLKDNQIVEVGLSIPILDWGKGKGKVKVAESNRDVVLSKIRQEQMDFNQDIFLLVENFNNQAAQLEIAAEVDTLAEKRYKTSIETFMIGKIDILDLNDAQSSKDDAKQKHIQELYYYWRYFYNIRSITLYDFLNNRTLDADFEEIVKR